MPTPRGSTRFVRPRPAPTTLTTLSRPADHFGESSKMAKSPSFLETFRTVTPVLVRIGCAFTAGSCSTVRTAG